MHANLVPYQLFDAADRALVIAVGSDAQWIACTRALGLEHLGAVPELRTNAGRLAARDRVAGEIAARVRTQPASVWLERLSREGVPSGIVRSVLEVLADGDGSALTGMPPSVPGAIRRAPPRLGEHSALVRARGWDAFADDGGTPP